jgi:phosphatidate phosphatase APP1
LRDKARFELSDLPPWNLHAFLVAFLRHAGLRWARCCVAATYSASSTGHEQKTGRIRGVLDLHPQLSFVLIGDSGEKDQAGSAGGSDAGHSAIGAVDVLNAW